MRNESGDEIHPGEKDFAMMSVGPDMTPVCGTGQRQHWHNNPKWPSLHSWALIEL